MINEDETVEMTREEIEAYIRMPINKNYAPVGFLLADDVPLSPAALTVARLVAERDEAIRQRDEARNCSLYTSIQSMAMSLDMYKREVSTLHNELSAVRSSSPVKHCKWAVKDKTDDTWLGLEYNQLSFTLEKHERMEFVSKRDARGFLDRYIKEYGPLPYSKPVFVRIK